MIDITKCPGENCNKRNNCYRYTAPMDEHWQSMCQFVVSNCREYWPIKIGKPRRR